jgi:hypothetical protein
VTQQYEVVFVSQRVRTVWAENLVAATEMAQERFGEYPTEITEVTA